MLSIEELIGNWKSTDSVYDVRLHFDKLPFDEYAIGKINFVDGKNETLYLAGELSIEDGFIVINEHRMPVQFTDRRFTAEIGEYGAIEFERYD